ncbi:MAG: hypothetical protein HS114_30555 [Anaerolineales bacterium]|nr:hypothetical protein [Anaerolineales bacterium]
MFSTTLTANSQAIELPLISAAVLFMGKKGGAIYEKIVILDSSKYHVRLVYWGH